LRADPWEARRLLIVVMAPTQRSSNVEVFGLAADATPEAVDALFRRIGVYCHDSAAHGVIVRVHGALADSREHLAKAIASLAYFGCPEGFKLAWIAPQRDAFETLVQTEYPERRSGIQSRAFVEDMGARTWLSW